MSKSTERSYNKNYIHVKYGISSTHCLINIREARVFKKEVKLQGQGHNLKCWYPWKGLVTRNIHALALTVHKLYERSMFLKKCQTPRSRSQGH